MTDKKKPKKLTGYKYLFTFGSTLEVYGKGSKRVLVDRRTGEIIVEYDIRHPIPPKY